MSDKPQVVFQSIWADKGKRTKIGEFAGLEFLIDQDMPDDEIRIVQNGRVIQKFSFWSKVE